MTIKKPGIAIIINGGIGVGFGLEGVICLVNLCEQIAKDYELVVFSLVKVNKIYKPKGYQLIGVPFEDNQSIILRFGYIFFKIIHLHFKRKFLIVHGFWAFPAGTLTLLIGKLLGLKTLVTFMGGEVANLESIGYGLYSSRMLKKLIQFTARNVDCVIALTNHHARKLRDNLTFKRIEIIAFGVDLTRFLVFNKPISSPYQFLYLGDINKVKNIPMLIKTFQEISKKIEARLDIVGLDTLNGEMQALVCQLSLGERVTFHGRQLNNSLANFLRKAHILLHTSFWESQAVVVNEAIAAGVVVCGTRVGIIEDLEGYITTAVAIDDSANLTHKVLELFNNPVKYDMLRASGIAWSKQNNLIIQCEKYSKLYSKLIEK